MNGCRSCRTGGITVAQKPRRGSIRVLLKGGRSGCILGIGGAVIGVGRANRGRAGGLGGYHQAGLNKGLGIYVLLGQPAKTHKKESGTAESRAVKGAKHGKKTTFSKQKALQCSHAHPQLKEHTIRTESK